MILACWHDRSDTSDAGGGECPCTRAPGSVWGRASPERTQPASVCRSDEAQRRSTGCSAPGQGVPPDLPPLPLPNWPAPEDTPTSHLPDALSLDLSDTPLKRGRLRKAG